METATVAGGCFWCTQALFKRLKGHQNYFEKNSSQLYCQLIINPKIDKLIREFGENVKK